MGRECSLGFSYLLHVNFSRPNCLSLHSSRLGYCIFGRPCFLPESHRQCRAVHQCVLMLERMLG